MAQIPGGRPIESIDSLGNPAQITHTDVLGKKSLDVNVTNISLDASTDSMAIKGPSQNSIDPNQSGSINASLEGLLEKIVLKALSRLSYNSLNQLRVETQLVNQPNNVIAGTVQVMPGQFNLVSTSFVPAQQNYQESFRRNLSIA